MVTGMSNSSLKPWRTKTLPCLRLTNTEIGRGGSLAGFCSTAARCLSAASDLVTARRLAAAATCREIAAAFRVVSPADVAGTNSLAFSISTGAAGSRVTITRAPTLVV